MYAQNINALKFCAYRGHDCNILLRNANVDDWISTNFTCIFISRIINYFKILIDNILENTNISYLKTLILILPNVNFVFGYKIDAHIQVHLHLRENI